MEANVTENANTENEKKENNELIKRIIRGQKDIDSTYKTSKIIDIVFGLSIIIVLIFIGIVLQIRLENYLKYEIVLVIGAIILEVMKVVLDYRQYTIMIKLIEAERKIIFNK